MDRPETTITTLRRIFKVEQGEGRLAILLGLLLFGNSMSIQMSSVIAISGFLGSDSINSFLIVLFFDMVLVLVATSFQSLIIDRFDRANLLRWVALAFAASFVILWLLRELSDSDNLYFSLLYILSEQQLLFFPLLVWTLAGDLLSPSQSKRLYPMINSLRFVGRITGLAIIVILSLIPAVAKLSAQIVLIADALFYVIAFAVVTLQIRSRHVERRSVSAPLKDTLLEGWSFIREVPLFRYLTLMVLFVSSADILIEFRFFSVTDITFGSVHSYETFFGLYRIVIAMAGFSMSSLLVSRLLQHVGLKNAFYLFPLAITVSAILMIVSPGIVAAVVAMGLMQLFRDTVYDSSRMSIYALVPNERRGRVSIFTDNYVMATGTLIGVVFAIVVIFGIGEAAPLPAHALYLGYVTAAGILALVFVYGLTKVYDKSLLNWRLRRRTRANKVLSGLDL